MRKFFSLRKSSKAQDRKLIFAIGFNKTGTTSIHRLFQDTGLKSVHWDEGRLAKTMLVNVIESKPIMQGYDSDFDVFSDIVYQSRNFWFEGNSLFRQIDRDYPNALFIYNYRDMDAWLKSRIKHPERVNGETMVDVHKSMLNTDDIDVVVEHWRETRLRFEEDVRSYFKGRSNFMEIDIADLDFVKKISSFLAIDFDPTHWTVHNKT